MIAPRRAMAIRISRHVMRCWLRQAEAERPREIRDSLDVLMQLINWPDVRAFERLVNELPSLLGELPLQQML